MQPDLDKYLPYLESLDLPMAEKYALIEVVCSITNRFVDLAFGCDPTQQARANQEITHKNAFQDSVKSLGFKNSSET